MSTGALLAALINIAIVVFGFRWYFNRQPKIGERAKAVRLSFIVVGIALVIYANVSAWPDRTALATIAAVGFVLIFVFALFPRLSEYLVRLLTKRMGSNLHDQR